MPLTTSLISYWELEEASGTRNDSHGSNHLTDNNTVLSATGKVGNAADFEDTNSEYLNRADNAALSTGDIDFTFALWVKMESKSGTQNRIIAKGTATDEEYTIYHDSAADRFVFAVKGSAGSGNGNGIGADTLGAVSLATWYFIVAWHDATANTLNIQVNNGGVDSVAHTFGVYDGAGDFYIGAGYPFPGGYFDGLIDQVGFWKRTLTTQERTDLYNSDNGLSYAGLSPTATITPTVAAASIAGIAGRMNLGLITPTTTKI